jgi:peptidoglycan-associated lipoprotein
MNRFFTLLLVLAATVLAGCAGSQDGSDKTTYYRATGDRSTGDQTGRIPSVNVTSSRQSSLQGPIGVARIVYFDFDRSIVRPIDRPIIQAHATYLQRNPNAKLSLEGSTDLQGGREYNLGLGQRRAEAVRSALVLLGVQDSQLEAVSLGMEKPASQTRTEQGDQSNRRVEFRYR